MAEMTNSEMNKAFNLWLKKYSRKEDDLILGPFLQDQIHAFVQGETGKLKKARDGLFLSSGTVAKNMKVSRAAYSKYEDCEDQGSITLATLSKAAEAMGCELVYAVRPKNRKFFSQIIWEKIFPHALKHPWLKKCDQRKRAEALAYVVNNLMIDPRFRREQGWSQRANTDKSSVRSKI